MCVLTKRLDPIINEEIEKQPSFIPHLIHCPSRHTHNFLNQPSISTVLHLWSRKRPGISDNGRRSCNRYVPVSTFALRIDSVGARHLTPSPLTDYTLNNPDTLTKYKTAAQISHKVLEAVSGMIFFRRSFLLCTHVSIRLVRRGREDPIAMSERRQAA